MARAVQVLGVEIDAVTMQEVVVMIGQAIDAAHGHGGAPLHVGTINPEHVMRARRDPRFMHTVRGCSVRTADGVGITLASRILRQRLPERVAGVHLVREVAKAAAARGDRVFFLGAADGVARAAADRLRNENPGLVVAGAMPGNPAPTSDPECLAAVRAARPDIILVAYGSPAEMYWIERNLAPSGAAVAIGIGGTFDELAGRVRLAPEWMQRAGLKWLFRLVTQPRRAPRMAVLPVFLLLVLRQGIGWR